MKSVKIDLFALGIFFIPFDNLFFAPSSGWATISPVIFFVYLCANINPLLKTIRRELIPTIILVFGILWQLLLIAINGLTLSAFEDTLTSLVMGVVFYLSIVMRYQIIGKDLDADASILYKAYKISFVYGLFRYVLMLFSPGMLSLFSLIEKRSYDRLAFTFTEPSFVSLHIIGVLWLFTYFVHNELLAKKMLRLGCLFLVLELISFGSARCIIDIGVFIALFTIRSVFYDSKHFMRNISLVTLIGVGGPTTLSMFPRLTHILLSGINSDPSMASRWFRVSAALNGFKELIGKTLLGFGIGNLGIPFQAGFVAARNAYTNPYTAEVDSLVNENNISSLFCFPIKLVSDWGVILTIVLIAGLVIALLYKHVDIFVILLTFWLYIQFDSYAFYSIWLLIYLARFYDPKKNGSSYFERIPNLFKRKSYIRER